MKILILGDVGPSEQNEQAFCNADKELFSKDIQDICRQSDIVLLNLEKPLTNIKTPLGKCPPDYIVPTETINGIKLLNPTAVTLANNHIMDQREQGLQSTIRTLSANCIQYVGAGENAREAKKPLIIDKDAMTIGIYACCEKEFSFATDQQPGANLFDPLETFDEIMHLREQCDYLIVLYHGGMQGYPYPTPYQLKVCRKMCEKGADLVVCQHSHIIGCEDRHSCGRIVYGQGNFLLDDVTDVNWQTGLMIQVTIDRENTLIDFIPVLTKNHNVILDPKPEEVIRGFSERSRNILNDNAVERLFAEFSYQRLSDYLVKLSGKRELTQRIFRRLGITSKYKYLYSDDVCYRIMDYLYCDSHRESIEYGINEYTKMRLKKKNNG